MIYSHHHVETLFKRIEDVVARSFLHAHHVQVIAWGHKLFQVTWRFSPRFLKRFGCA
jgi:hypothetical protein